MPGNTPALRNARLAADHTEAQSLLRLREKLGTGAFEGLPEIHLTTAGHHVCGFCIGTSADSGLLEIAEAMNIDRLVIHAADGFDSQTFKSFAGVIIENGTITGFN